MPECIALFTCIIGFHKVYQLLQNKHQQKKIFNLYFFFQMFFFRLSISFFAISGLDVLGRLDLLDKHREEYINWIYLFQILPNQDDESLERCGFRGSLAATLSLESHSPSHVGRSVNIGTVSSHPLDTSHITMTYAAINTLLILGDDLGRLQRKGILAGVKALQLENGR